MQAFFTWFDAFLSSGSFWVYIVIFFGKVLEVSLCTLRIVLINRGERVKGSLIDVYKRQLLGENGSGKTTLMNMLSGIYYPDEGQIYIHGKPCLLYTSRCV